MSADQYYKQVHLVNVEDSPEMQAAKGIASAIDNGIIASISDYERLRKQCDDHAQWMEYVRKELHKLKVHVGCGDYESHEIDAIILIGVAYGKLQAENVQLTACMKRAGLECLMGSSVTLDQVANHMAMVRASWNDMEHRCNQLKRAAIELANAADVYRADQSGATDNRVGLVPPVTVSEAKRLNQVCDEFDKVMHELESDGKAVSQAAGGY